MRFNEVTSGGQPYSDVHGEGRIFRFYLFPLWKPQRGKKRLTWEALCAYTLFQVRAEYHLPGSVQYPEDGVWHSYLTTMAILGI